MIDTNTAGVRLDQELGTLDRLAFRYLFTSQVVNAFQLIAGQNPDTTTRSNTGRMSWTRSWSAAMVSNLSIGFDRLGSLLVPEEHAVGPTVSFGSVLTGLGPGSDLPIDRVQNEFRYAAQVQMQRGHHTLVMGGELKRLQVNGLESSSNRGVIYFTNDFGRDAITNLRLGIPGRMSTGIGDARRGFRYWDPQWFAGDTWRVRKDLNVALSVRYKPIIGPREVNDLTPIPYNCDCNNFAPQVGIAYTLPGDSGVVRVAYGLHYSPIYPVTFQQLRFNAPRFLKIEVQAPNSLLDPLQGISIGPNTRTTAFDLPRNTVAPYSHQYNFSWERSLGRNVNVQLGYVGSRTHKILMLWTTNRASPVTGIPQTTKTIESRRADQSHYEIRRIVNGSNAYFDAGRISVVSRTWHSFGLDASYWWSKAVDLGANYTNTAASDDGRQGKSQSEFDVLQDLKGLSSFDQPHAFLARVSFHIALRPSEESGRR